MCEISQSVSAVPGETFGSSSSCIRLFLVRIPTKTHSLSVSNFVPEQQALGSQITEPAHTTSLQKKVFYYFFFTSAWCRRGGTKATREKERASSRDAIDLPLPQLGQPSFLRGGGEEGRRNATLQVTNSKESSSRDFSLILKMWNPRAQHMW